VKDNAVELKHNAQPSRKLLDSRKSAAVRWRFTECPLAGRCFPPEKSKKASPAALCGRRNRPVAFRSAPERADCGRWTPSQVTEIACIGEKYVVGRPATKQFSRQRNHFGLLAQNSGNAWWLL